MIDVIIVNWNAGEQIVTTIESIAKFGRLLVKSVIVVDNASIDNSMGAIKERNQELDLPLIYIENEENLGFGAACNQGAAVATSNYLLFLNPDTALFSESLTIPYYFLTNPENASTAAAGIKLIDSQGRIARSCARFPTLVSFALHSLGLTKLSSLRRYSMHMSDWAHDTTRYVDHVIGAFLLMRRQIFVDLNGFDERFFVYLEDLDLSLRIHEDGHKIVYLSEAQAFHAGGGTSSKVKARRLYYSLKSRLMYGQKHFSPTNSMMLAFLTLTLEPISRVVQASVKRNWSDIVNTTDAYRMLYRALSEIYGKKVR